MFKKMICASMAAVMLFTSVAAGAATGRQKTTVPANWSYGGNPTIAAADKGCMANAATPEALYAKVEPCVKANIKRLTPPSQGTVVFTNEGPVEMNGTSGRGKRFTAQFYLDNGKRFITQYSVLMYAWADCGSGQDATLGPNGTSCTVKETVNACIERQDAPNRVALSNAKKGCLATEDKKVADITTKFARWKAYGIGATAAVVAFMVTVPGAGPAALTALFSGTSIYEWGDYCDKREAFAKKQAHAEEQACEAPYASKYRSLNTAIVNACQSS